MIEILPIKILRDEDSPIFGKLNVNLSKLANSGLPVAEGIVVTPPNLKLKTLLERHNFDSYEVIEQSLTLVKREVQTIPEPDVLIKEVGRHNKFMVNGQLVNGAKGLWLLLLQNWLDDLKQLIWTGGFFLGITENLEPQIVIFVKDLKAFGITTLDEYGEVVIMVDHGKIDPEYQKELDELVSLANKKLLIPHEFSWVLDGGVKLCGIRPYTPDPVILSGTKDLPRMWVSNELRDSSPSVQNDKNLSAIKILLDLSVGEIPAADFNGIYLVGEKIYDLNKPQDSFDRLVLKIVECGNTGRPVLLKLADKSEGMGKVRGALRLIHQKNLFDSFVEAVNFVREQKVWRNIQLVIPFVRGISEFSEVKRQLAMKKITRGGSVSLWMEVCVPENIINLEGYAVAGLDGFILNMDELMSHLSGFDITEAELLYYKKDVKALLTFLEDGIKMAHKLKVPFIATGSIVLYPEVLEYLVEHGVYGVVVERYEADAGKDLLLKMEKKVVLKNAS